MKTKLLVVDDDADTRELLDKILDAAGYNVLLAEDGASTMEILESVRPDLILLDLMLPDIGGFEVCRLIRGKPDTRDIPVIMVTSVGKIASKILGFQKGIDDYVTKPFDQAELLGRISAILRRSQAAAAGENTLKSGDLVFYPERHCIMIGKEEIRLRPKENALLLYLMAHKHKVLEREGILENVWGMEYVGETRTLDVHIRYLRSKLARHAKKIVTIESVGYKFTDCSK